MTLTASSVADYLSRVLGEVAPLRPLRLALLDAFGSVLAEDVRVDTPLPIVDTAAVSGYAVATADVRGASADNPATLAVVGDVGVGRWQIERLAPGGCMTITAGAAVPAGADAVVPAEWTDGGMVTVRVEQVPKKEHGMVRAGAVVPAHTLIGRHGQAVTAGMVGLLAQVGREHVLARPRPRLIILGVGTEYVEIGASSAPGQTTDAASYVVTSCARMVGAQAFRLGALGDDPERIASTIADNAMRADLLVTTGDARLITQLFSDVETVQLPIAPHGTIAFGRVGPDETPIICVPGEAGAAFVWYELLIRPMIRRLVGCDQTFRRSVKATLAEPVTSPEGAREFRPGLLSERRGGGYTVRALPGERHFLTSLSVANGLIALSDQVGNVPAGASLDVMLLDQV